MGNRMCGAGEGNTLRFATAKFPAGDVRRPSEYGGIPHRDGGSGGGPSPKLPSSHRRHHRRPRPERQALLTDSALMRGAMIALR